MPSQCDRHLAISKQQPEQPTEQQTEQRKIYCPLHCCDLASMSQRYPLFEERAGQSQRNGLSLKRSRLVLSSRGTVPLEGEWLEAFWCDHCKETRWYHVCRVGAQGYTLRLAARELWQQVPGGVRSSGNALGREVYATSRRG